MSVPLILTLPPHLQRQLSQRTPLLWLNPSWRPIDRIDPAAAGMQMRDVREAHVRWQRFASLLRTLYPELIASDGIIESPLLAADRLRTSVVGDAPRAGRWLIKTDHALPIAGSIKARGGIYEVLLHAEELAIEHGLTAADGNTSALASEGARALFARHEISVGSTGNLGLSIGIAAAALGFQATVHMSSDAKPWKKARLRDRGVTVVEHSGDFGAAVAAGRAQARGKPDIYFVDDENSSRLFLGYSVAALRLQQQLVGQGIKVDAQHPLFVYLPCGVGGAPGGITFGLRNLFGDHVHCFFAEPVASPCMLLRLALAEDRPVSIREIELDGRTEADGLAVGEASGFVAPLMRPLLSGVFTVTDDDLFAGLFRLDQTERLRIEPSAAAAFPGPLWLLQSPQGDRYLAAHDLENHMPAATHILWTTGGAFVPDEEYRAFHERGRLLTLRDPTDTSLGQA